MAELALTHVCMVQLQDDVKGVVFNGFVHSLLLDGGWVVVPLAQIMTIELSFRT